MSRGFARYAVILGLLAAIGPFAIDMYLPALPSIGESLRASPAAVQMSLMAFFIAMALGQMIYGPMSDMLGRKVPLYFGLAVFAVASIGCGLAQTVETLIAFRFVQGIGACAGMVVPRAVVRDLHTGPDAARLMSLIMLVFSVSPILAPLAGSFVIKAFGWRGVFWAVTIAAVAGLIILATSLQETRPEAERRESGVRSALAAYRVLLGDGHFLVQSFVGAFGISSFFIYIASSSFVFIDHYGLSPTGYSLAFSVNAVAFFGAAQTNGWLGARFGLKSVVRVAVLGYAAAMVALLVAVLAGFDQMWLLIMLLLIGNAFLALVIPTTAVLALEDHGAIAGTASALLGTLQFATGALAIAAAGLFANGTPLPMVAGIATCAVIALALAYVPLGARDPVEAAAE